MISSPATSTSVRTVFVFTDSEIPRRLISATIPMKTSAASVVGTLTNSPR